MKRLHVMPHLLRHPEPRPRNKCGVTGLLMLLFLFSPQIVEAAEVTESHGLNIFGELKYPKGFKHFDYVNPDAPKGGLLKLADSSPFDSLNPFIIKGVKAPGLAMIFESLMVASLDEPQSLYGLVAESVTLDKQGTYAEFTLRKEARWQDGTAITPDDVVFSFETLKTKGSPQYAVMLQQVVKVEKTAENKVRYHFSGPKNRELPTIVASLPILSKAYYTKHDFEKTTLESPLGSGPYKIAEVDPGRKITYKIDPNYWGKNLALNVGSNNIETIQYDVYRDETVSLEALKAGEYDVREEYIARNWASSYDTPALKRGDLIKEMIPHKIPPGMQAFFFNMRKPYLADRRVREAIGLAVDFEWLNKTIFYGAYTRSRSFFGNTESEAKGLPTGKELELLSQYKDQLPPELFTKEFNPPTTDGSGNPRENLLRAKELLKQAGWVVENGKLVNEKTKEPFKVEFLLHQQTMERVVAPLRKNLAKLGIDASMRVVDDSQYQKRVDSFDFDIIISWIMRGIVYPGNEQLSFWDSSQKDVQGSNNIVGLASPVVDALLKKIVEADNKEDFLAATRALDRVLQWEFVALPHWHLGFYRVAYWNRFSRPAVQPEYGLGLSNWWVDKEKEAKLKRP